MGDGERQRHLDKGICDRKHDGVAWKCGMAWRGNWDLRNLRDSRFRALLPSVLTDGSLVNGHPDRDFGIRSGRCVDWNDIAFLPGPAPLHDLITESAHLVVSWTSTPTQASSTSIRHISVI